MTAHLLDTFKLLASLKATGKDANYTAEEIVGAIDVAQDAVDLLTVPVFEGRMGVVDARFDAIDIRFDAIDAKFGAIDGKFGAIDAKFDAIDDRFEAFDAKLDAVRADIKAEVKSSQMQNLLWLSGIMLASNGAVIALLARAAKLY
jgi:hypothetical protein